MCYNPIFLVPLVYNQKVAFAIYLRQTKNLYKINNFLYFSIFIFVDRNCCVLFLIWFINCIHYLCMLISYILLAINKFGAYNSFSQVFGLFNFLLRCSLLKKSYVLINFATQFIEKWHIGVSIIPLYLKKKFNCFIYI